MTGEEAFDWYRCLGRLVGTGGPLVRGSVISRRPATARPAGISSLWGRAAHLHLPLVFPSAVLGPPALQGTAVTNDSKHLQSSSHPAGSAACYQPTAARSWIARPRFHSPLPTSSPPAKPLYFRTSFLITLECRKAMHIQLSCLV